MNSRFKPSELPTPEEIEERAAAIREEWCDGDYEHPDTETWMQKWEREYFSPWDGYFQQPLGAAVPGREERA